MFKLAVEIHDYPVRQLAIGLQAHAALRVLRALVCVSAAITEIDVSIVAGCTQSNEWARVTLYDLLDKIHILYPQEGPFQHVDDLYQHAEHPNEDVLVNRSVGAATLLVKGLISKGFKVNAKKSLIIPSSSMAAKRVKARLQQEGIELAADVRAKDLGIDAGAGRIRTTKTIKGRLLKCRRRSFLIGMLARKVSAAKKLFSTGALPQLYGYQGTGLPPSAIAKVRAMALEASGANRGGQVCTATVLAIKYGDDRDPEITIRVGQIKAWIEFWHTADLDLRNRTRKAWSRALPNVLGPNRWKYVCGFMTATIATLADIGWTPDHPDRWLLPGGDQYCDVDFITYTWCTLKAAIVDTIQKNIWTRASNHYLAHGIESELPDFTIVRRTIKRFERKGEFGAAGMLLVVAAGGCWHDSRVADAWYESIELCSRCHAAFETPLHRYWQCDGNKDTGIDAIDKSNGLCRLACRDAENCPVLWLRGVVPGKTVEKPALPDEPILHRVGTVANHSIDDLEFYTDGSGGEQNRDVRLRRVGAAAVAIDLQGELVAALFSGVPCRQTVPRAELYGEYLNIILVAPIARGLTVKTRPDASYIINTWRRDREQLKKTSNGDLWQITQNAENVCDVRLDPSKIDAHLTGQHVEQGIITQNELIGNGFADAFSKRSAKECAVPHATITSQNVTDAISTKIIARLVAIDMLLAGLGLQRRPNPLKGQQVRDTVSIQDLMNATQHAMYFDGDTHKCWRC